MAKTKNIGNDISINIPNNYEYFELTFELFLYVIGTDFYLL